MIIKTKIGLKNLKGEEFKNEEGEVFTLGQALANIVVGAKEDGKMKLFLLGTKLFQNEKVEVDEVDLLLLKRAVKTTEIYGALIAGQCELLLESLNEKPNETTK